MIEIDRLQIERDLLRDVVEALREYWTLQRVRTANLNQAIAEGRVPLEAEAKLAIESGRLRSKVGERLAILDAFCENRGGPCRDES